MPGTSREKATETVEVEGYEGHFENFDGGYTVGFETYTADSDLSPFFHWPSRQPVPVTAVGLRGQGQSDLPVRGP
jgi:hypothetical protein